MRTPKRSRPTYIAQTLVGFEAIAANAINTMPQATVLGTAVVPERNGMVLFEYGGETRDLLQLRVIEDLFFVVARLEDLRLSREGLNQLESLAARAPGIDAGLQLVRQLQPGRGGRGKVQFRVVARQAQEAAYRRVDAQKAVERGITSRTDHQWRLTETGAIEFWLTLFPDEAVLALRLSDEHMRHRDYKIEHLPASLRPSAAAALVWLTRPDADDVFLDPMCGAGTLLIERAHTSRYAQLLGGDIREEAIVVARANIGPRYKPIEVRRWDVRSLPLDEASATAAAVNLPFGRQIGSVSDNRTLYPATLRELVRVLRPGARLAALTGDVRTFGEALRRAPQLERREHYQVEVLGRSASVIVVERS